MHAWTTSASLCISSLCISSCSTTSGATRRRWSSASWAACGRCSRQFAQATAISSAGRASTATDGQPTGQAEQADHPAVLDQRHRVASDQVGRPLHLPGGQRVGDRLGHQVVAGEPGRRAPVQLRYLVRAVALQSPADMVVKRWW